MLSLLSAFWASPTLRMVALGAAVLSFTYFKGRASVDQESIRQSGYSSGYKAGQVARDSEWKKRLAEAEVATEARINEWRLRAQEAEEKDHVPQTAPELEALCVKDPLCRQ